jgi:hypothetical protein
MRKRSLKIWWRQAVSPFGLALRTGLIWKKFGRPTVFFRASAVKIKIAHRIAETRYLLPVMSRLACDMA